MSNVPLLDDDEEQNSSHFIVFFSNYRMQLQGQSIGSAQLSRLQRPQQRHYRYFWNCWSRILKEEGFSVLYRGLSPALLRQSVYGTIKFGLYPNLKSREVIQG